MAIKKKALVWPFERSPRHPLLFLILDAAANYDHREARILFARGLHHRSINSSITMEGLLKECKVFEQKTELEDLRAATMTAAVFTAKLHRRRPARICIHRRSTRRVHSTNRKRRSRLHCFAGLRRLTPCCTPSSGIPKRRYTRARRTPKPLLWREPAGGSVTERSEGGSGRCCLYVAESG